MPTDGPQRVAEEVGGPGRVRQRHEDLGVGHHAPVRVHHQLGGLAVSAGRGHDDSGVVQKGAGVGHEALGAHVPQEAHEVPLVCNSVRVAHVHPASCDCWCGGAKSQ